MTAGAIEATAGVLLAWWCVISLAPIPLPRKTIRPRPVSRKIGGGLRRFSAPHSCAANFGKQLGAAGDMAAADLLDGIQLLRFRYIKCLPLGPVDDATDVTGAPNEIARLRLRQLGLRRVFSRRFHSDALQNCEDRSPEKQNGRRA
jgi:hypothetical protein